MPDQNPRLVLTSVGSAEDADTLARALVEGHVAACVSIVPLEASVYRWKGEICAQQERLLVIKTTLDRVGALKALLATIHPYELPELLVLEATASAGYFAWLTAETRPV
jgi:periplasmic divalent cation tolerance protein